MRRLVVAIAFGGLALASTGCLRKTLYKCDESTDCGAGGVCEDTGYCSVADAECAQGRRYTDLAGTYANRCVGESNNPDIDAPVVNGDGPMGDVPVINNCPTSYTVTHGTKRYRVIATAAAHATQEAACAADGTGRYLAVPNDQAELTAILAAANVATIWVGIEDVATEGTYTTANNMSFSASSPLWDTGEPDDNPSSGGGSADCALAQMSNGQLLDDRCTDTHAAVCECDP